MGLLDYLNGRISAADILAQIDGIVHQDAALPGALQLILKTVAEGLDAEACSLLMAARGRRELHMAASFGLPEEVARSARLNLDDRSVSSRVLKSGETLRLLGPVRDARFEGAGPHLASSLIVPVELGGECIGALSVSSPAAGKPFSERALWILQKVSLHIALMVERLRLTDSLLKAMDAAEALREAGQRLKGCAAPRPLFEALADGAARLVGADCAAVLTLRENPDRTWARGIGDDALACLERAGGRLGPKLLESGRKAAARETDLAGAYGPQAESAGCASGLAVPLCGKEGVIGALELYASESYEFPDDEVRLIESLAHWAAGVLENMRLAERLETERSQSVQKEKLATLGQLVAGIAHEVQNPLSGIIGYTQLLKDGLRKHPHLQEDLGHIERETLRLRKLASSMMNFARPAESRPMSVSEIVEMSLAILHCDVKRSGAQLVTEFGAAPPIFCDPGQLEQIFINVLLNSLQSLDGRPRRQVTVRTFYKASADAVHAQVVDTGCGIRPEDLPRVCEVGFTTKRGGRGSGFGLAMTAGAVRRQGGRLDISSVFGEGTTVSLSFPTGGRHDA